MGFEWQLNKEKLEGIIDLKNLAVVFCEDGIINSYYESKQAEMTDKDKWIEENQDYLKQNEARITKAVETGQIHNGNPETIWRYRLDMFEGGKEKALEIKKELEERIEQIKAEVAKRLSKFLPDWKLENATVTFTMNESANFCVDGTSIIVDIGRLVWEKDAVEKVIEGMAHEVFHIWMKEKKIESGEESVEKVKAGVISGIVDEGLAVLISGQSLSKHHENQGRNYDEYKVESFHAFREFLKQSDLVELEKYSSESFKDMGYSYVVGYEVAKKILQRMGIERFRRLIDECRMNPKKMFNESDLIN